MALMLVFSIGGQSARTGFALGRRALAAAVDEVTQDQLRGLIRDPTPAPIGGRSGRRSAWRRSWATHPASRAMRCRSGPESAATRDRWAVSGWRSRPAPTATSSPVSRRSRAAAGGGPPDRGGRASPTRSMACSGAMAGRRRRSPAWRSPVRRRRPGVAGVDVHPSRQRGRARRAGRTRQLRPGVAVLGRCPGERKAPWVWRNEPRRAARRQGRVRAAFGAGLKTALDTLRRHRIPAKSFSVDGPTLTVPYAALGQMGEVTQEPEATGAFTAVRPLSNSADGSIGIQMVLAKT